MAGTYKPWKSLTLGGIIPALNTQNPDSMMSKARSSIEASFNDFSQKFNAITQFYSELIALKNQAEAAKDEVNRIFEAVNNTGFHAAVIKGAVGRADFEGTINRALNDATAPNIGSSTSVGAIMLVFTGVDTEEVNNKIAQIRNIMSGL